MIKFGCGVCGKRIGVADAAAGRRVRCPKCAEPTRVPEAKPEAPTAAASSAAGLDALAGLESDGPLELRAVEAPVPVATKPADASADAPPPSPASGGGAAKDCPKCGAPATASAKICVGCGHGFSGLSAAGRARTRRAGVLAGRSGIAIVGGLVTALGCGFIWAMIAKVTGYEAGFIATLLGAGTGLVTALIAQQQSVLVGLGAVVTALLGWFAAKAMIAWLVITPMILDFVVDLDEDGRSGYVMERLDAEGGMTDAMWAASWDPEEADPADVAAVEAAVAGWIAENGDPGPSPWQRQAMSMERVVAAGALDADTWWDWQDDGLDADEYRRVDALVAQDIAANGEPEVMSAREAVDEVFSSNVQGGIAFLGALSLYDLLWVPLMCFAAYKTGNGD